MIAEGKVETLHLWENSHPDPSGNGQEDDFYTFDICENCLFDFFNYIRKNHYITPLLALHMSRYLRKKEAIV